MVAKNLHKNGPIKNNKYNIKNGIEEWEEGLGGIEVLDDYMLTIMKNLSKYLKGKSLNVELKELVSILKDLGYRINDSLDYLVSVDEMKTRIKKKCIIPFCGSKISDRCNGIKLNYGLYSQCMNEISGSDIYCKTCLKQGVKSGKGEPTYGDISERIRLGKDWRDKKGKEAVRYANVMDKLEISREEGEKEAERLGLKIPEIEFEMKEVKRGRPKKSVEVSDTESECSIEKKKRGRPRKEKQIVSSLCTGDDLIAGLINSAKNDMLSLEKDKKEVCRLGEYEDKKRLSDEKKIDMNIIKDEVKSERIENKEEEEDEEEVEEVEVEKFIDPKTNIEYYKTEDNILYTMDSEPVGRWNEKSGEIEPILDLEEDDN